MIEFDLKNFECISIQPYAYRLFKDDQNTHLMEVTCGTHGLWEVWIHLTEEEVELYKKEGNTGLEKIAKLISYHCYNPDYRKRYLKITE